MGAGRFPHRPQDIHRSGSFPRHPAQHRDEMDWPLRLQGDEALHRHRRQHQGQRDVQDEFPGLTRHIILISQNILER